MVMKKPWLKLIFLSIKSLTKEIDKRIKRNSQERFDSEISEKLIIQDKLFKKYKKTRLHVDKEIYNRARKKNFLKTNSKSVLVNLKTYGKLLNHSDYLINLVDV